MASRNPMLLKILEDYPNSNQSNSVKSESTNDFLLNDLFNCNSSTYLNSLNRSNSRSFLDTPNQLNYHTVSLNSNQNNHNSIAMNSHLPNTSSFFQTDQLFNNNCIIGNTISTNLNNKTKFNNNLNLQLTNKSQFPKNDIDDQDSIDLLSKKGKFGWTSCNVYGNNDIPLPYILRKDDKLIPVRIVETKLINPYGTDIPHDVFNCINIKSFYITDNESKLLNEINTLHCDNYYGNDKFTTNDVVVNLNDVFKINNFLEISKKVFIQGLSKCDFLGFVQISGNSTVIPFIIKETENINKQKQESNSSITSPLSNLSIKKPIQDQQQSQIQDDFINYDKQPNKSLQPLKDLKPDDLSGFFNDDNDDLLSKIDNSNDNQFNDNNSLSGLDDDNLDHHLNTNFNNQFENIILELDNDLNNDLNNLDQQTNFFQTNSASFNNNLKKKFVPVFLVEDHLMIDDAEQIELNEWDVSYLKMCSIYAGFDSLKKQFTELSSDLTNCRNQQSKYNLNLVCLNDVKWDKTYNPITIKEIHVNSVCKLRNQQPLNNYQSTSSSLHSLSSNLNNNLIASNKKYSLHTQQHYQPSQSSSSYNFKKTNLTKDSNCDPFNITNKLISNNYTSSSNLNKYSPSSSDYSSTSDSTDRINGLQFAINNFTNSFANNDNSNLFQSNPSTSNFNQFNNITTHVNNYDTRDRSTNTNLSSTIGQLNSNLNNQSNNTNYNQSTKSNHQFNFNKNYSGLSNLNSIQNTSSLFLDDIMKLNLPSNGLNNQSLTNQLIGSSLQYNNNHQNNNLQLISNLSNNLQSAYHQQNSPVNNLQPGTINQLNQLIDEEPFKISFIQIENKSLKTINLKPHTNLQAIQLSEIEKQFFDGIGLNQLKNYLEKRLNVKLYDLSRTQQYALYQYYGLHPSQEDKLILVDDLVKINLSQLKLILCYK